MYFFFFWAFLSLPLSFSLFCHISFLIIFGCHFTFALFSHHALLTPSSILWAVFRSNLTFLVDTATYFVMIEWMRHSINHSIDQLMDQLVDQSMNRWINYSMTKSMNEASQRIDFFQYLLHCPIHFQLQKSYQTLFRSGQDQKVSILKRLTVH